MPLAEIKPFSGEAPSFSPAPPPRPAPSFSPQQPTSFQVPDSPAAFRPDRPKRQRPPASFTPQQSYEEDVLPVLSGDNPGFMNDVNFPSIEAFGVGWDPQKVRRKREARDYQYYKPTRPGRRPRRPRPARQSSRRQGPGGFWDDADFDAEFFNGGSPQVFNGGFDGFGPSRPTTTRPSRPGRPSRPVDPFKVHFSPPEDPRFTQSHRRPVKRKISPKKVK